MKTETVQQRKKRVQKDITKAKENKFFDVDPDFKFSRKMLAKIEKRIGWKSLYYEIQHYQKHFHPETPYNFDKL